MKEKDIHLKLKELRKSRGLSVNTLAQKMGENHQKVGRVERGQSSLTVDYLMKVSNALDAPLESFLSKAPPFVSSHEAHSPSPGRADTDLLSDLVVLTEKYVQDSGIQLNSEEKGSVISKLFALSGTFPTEYRRQFLHAFFEGISPFLSSVVK